MNGRGLTTEAGVAALVHLQAVLGCIELLQIYFPCSIGMFNVQVNWLSPLISGQFWIYLDHQLSAKHPRRSAALEGSRSGSGSKIWTFFPPEALEKFGQGEVCIERICGGTFSISIFKK